MIYSNRKSTDRFKIVVGILGITYLLAVVAILFMQQFTLFFTLGGIFLVLLILFAIINFQYLSISNKGPRLIVRYFPVFSVSRSYKSIEFPVGNLKNIEVKSYLFGIKPVMRFTVRTRRGIADYPPISLSAVPFKERGKLIELLNNLRVNKK